MENASKALLMAGGIILTMLIVSLLLYGWTSLTEYQESQDRIKEVEDLAKFNQQFTNYERNDVQGYDLLSLVNKVIDYNQRKSKNFNEESAAGNDAVYKEITVNILMYDQDTTAVNLEDDIVTKGDLKTLLTRTITFPKVKNKSATNSIGEKDKLTLFKEQKYKQNNASNTFKDAVLDKVKKIEEKFGGATNIQNLVKNIDTIYQGEIIGYNEGTPDSGWYDENYIISRYKTLTGLKAGSVDDIRKEDKAEEVLKYYEYSYFKKSIFECTKVEYDKDTGRVIQMDFRFTGELM